MDQDSNEVRRSIPSCMKHRSIWEVNIGEALIVKKRTMVSTKQEVEDKVFASVNHITITEDIKEEPLLKTMLRMLHPHLKKVYRPQSMN